MPELPEVETVRRGLEPALSGQTLARVIQRRADLRWPLPERFAERLTGRRVAALRRRSKFILAELDRGETLILHLGMSGRLLIGDAPTASFHHAAPTGAGKHDHVVFETGAGTVITYNDARRFGAMDLAPTDGLERHRWLAGLGPEPMSNAFSGPVLAAALAGRRSPVKAALLDQRVVAGLGNIYVAEALHRAGIAPWRRAGAIAASRVERLAEAIRATLADALAAGGSSLRDYRRADGELGYFQHTFRVYHREGAPCRREGCTGTIRRRVQGGRSSFWCPRCQR